MCLILCLLLVLPFTDSVLPEYQPATDQNIGRDELIRAYFQLGYSYKEILVSLVYTHGVVLSYRHLKRLLRQMGLRRKLRNGAESSLESIVTAIVHELEGSASSLGYRALWKRLIAEYQLHVRRDIVLQLLRIIDPEGVQRRKAHRLLRRKYAAPGPNFIWHVDGYDKLKQFGFAIHGAIDGFSRKIMWLEVDITNNNPSMIANYYLDCLEQIGSVPRIVRSDLGTENSKIKLMQTYFRYYSDDAFAAFKSFMYGKSTSNQRIEAWWSILRKQRSDWWLHHFKELRDSGLYLDYDPFHIECMKFCYMDVLQVELHQVAKEWNLHVISSKKNAEGPRGKPDIMFFNPTIYGTIDYGTPIDLDDTAVCKAMYGMPRLQHGCLPEFLELVYTINPNLQLPTSAAEARLLYLTLTQDLGRLREN